VFIFVTGLAYLEWRRCQAQNEGEGHSNEPEPIPEEKLVNPWIAILPLVVVGVLNKLFTNWIPQAYGTTYEVSLPGLDHPITIPIGGVAAIWAVQGAPIAGILTVFIFAFRHVSEKFAEGSKSAVAGALLASINTASEYGFGAVIAALRGFLVIRDALRAIPNPLINEAITVTTLAGHRLRLRRHVDCTGRNVGRVH
jgi:H+/gluconate symporter-like permease